MDVSVHFMWGFKEINDAKGNLLCIPALEKQRVNDWLLRLGGEEMREQHTNTDVAAVIKGG